MESSSFDTQSLMNNLPITSVQDIIKNIKDFKKVYMEDLLSLKNEDTILSRNLVFIRYIDETLICNFIEILYRNIPEIQKFEGIFTRIQEAMVNIDILVDFYAILIIFNINADLFNKQLDKFIETLENNS